MFVPAFLTIIFESLRSQNRELWGSFHSTNIPVWNFGNSTSPMERYIPIALHSDSDCTDPTQATARLVIVLVSRIQKSGTEDNNFVKWKGTFWSDRPKCPDRSKWTIFNAGSSYVDILFQCHKPKTCLVWSILLYFILFYFFF